MTNAYQPGTVLTLYAALTDANGTLVPADHVSLTVTPPDGTAAPVSFSLAGSQYAATYSATTTPGEYAVTWTAASPYAGSVIDSFVVRPAYASTSYTTDWSPDAAELVTEAWERCGRNPEDLSGEIARSARRSLMLMLLQWANRGVNLWTVEAKTLALVAGQASYTLSRSTIALLDAVVTRGGLDTPLVPIGRTEYVAIAAKATRGQPTQYWLERTTPYPALHLFPVPENNTDTITYWRMRLPQDMTAGGQTVEVPPLWLEAAVAGLAARLAQKFAADRLQVLTAMASEAYTAAANENRERVPFIVRPRVCW